MKQSKFLLIILLALMMTLSACPNIELQVITIPDKEVTTTVTIIENYDSLTLIFPQVEMDGQLDLKIMGYKGERLITYYRCNIEGVIDTLIIPMQDIIDMDLGGISFELLVIDEVTPDCKDLYNNNPQGKIIGSGTMPTFP